LGQSIWRLLCRIALVLVLIYLFLHLRGIIDTLLIGAIIAYMFEPTISWLARQVWFHDLHQALHNLTPKKPHITRHSLRLYSSIYVLIIGIAISVWGAKLVVTPFTSQIQQIVANKETYQKWYEQRVSQEWRDTIEEQLTSEKTKEKIADFAFQGAKSLKYVVEVVLLPVLAFYFILDGRRLKREFLGLVRGRVFRESGRMLYEFNQIMRSYVVGQFILCALAGIIVGLGLALIGVRYAFVLAVLAGVTRAIPIVGPIIGGIPIIGITLVDDPTNGVRNAILVLIFFTIMHFVESKFIMPMLIGERMELHPVVIIVVLLIGGEIGALLLGGTIGALLGMFFAPPLAAILRVMIRRYILRLPRAEAHTGH
jgi:predicted PurR-regulated permease PerM